MRHRGRRRINSADDADEALGVLKHLDDGRWHARESFLRQGLAAAAYHNERCALMELLIDALKLASAAAPLSSAGRPVARAFLDAHADSWYDAAAWAPDLSLAMGREEVDVDIESKRRDWDLAEFEYRTGVDASDADARSRATQRAPHGPRRGGGARRRQ